MDIKRNQKTTSIKVKRYLVIPVAIFIATFVFAININTIRANASTAIIKNSNPYAKNPYTSIKSGWQKTYYKCLDDTRYLKIALKKSTFVIKLVRKGQKGTTFEKGYYVTWLSEAWDEPEDFQGKLMLGKKSGILWSFERKSGGDEIEIEPQKHILEGKHLEYIPGTYYKTLKQARKSI